MLKPGISILICTYNGARTLEPVLENLAQQASSFSFPIEYILVDNSSTDETGSILEAFAQKYPSNTKHLIEKRKGKSYAFETGVQAAAHSILLMVDDDNLLDDGYLLSVFDILSNENVGACAGYGRLPSKMKVPAFVHDYEEAYALKTLGENQGISYESTLTGAGLAMKTALVKALYFNGYQSYFEGPSGKERILGEELELTMLISHLGYQLELNPSLSFQHLLEVERFTLENFHKLYYDIGRPSPYLENLRDLDAKTSDQSFINLNKGKYLFKVVFFRFLGIFTKVNPKLHFCKGYLYSLSDKHFAPSAKRKEMKDLIQRTSLFLKNTLDNS